MYVDTIVQKYIDLFKANTGAIKVFYQGEPIRIANSDLPCAMISKRETRVTPLNNAADEHAIGMSMTVIVDVRKDLSTDDSQAAINAGVATLYEIMEGRNADYTLKDESVLSILRHNITLDSANNLRTDLGSQTRVDYGMTLQSSRGREEWRIEARVDFVAHFTQTR